ncbi:MAG: glycerol-3-phosphate dehydrogenase [Candidatus Latescibacterota bacterium]
MKRQRGIAADFADRVFDLIVIGAGINGTGIARDAALRGLRVLLLEKGDLCAGTSAWSSRLIHGGLRYLEHAELDLVRESLRERERLFANAPHLVKPLSFFIPLYKTNKRPPWMVKVGMVGYDLLSPGRSVAGHAMLTRAEALAHLPGLNPENLLGAATYYDGQVELAERLCVENALSARDGDAEVLTYARVENFIVEDNSVRGVQFIDVLDGGEYEALAPVVINASGPWVDEVLKGVGQPIGRLLGGTKGTHLVVDSFSGAPNDALYIEAAHDGRPIFVLPWQGRYLIGTTDTHYTSDLDEVRPEEGEVAYLLQELNHIFPLAELVREDVLYAYCGVRPLPYVTEGATSKITRRHKTHDHAPELRGLISVIGGKLTTYRSLAEEVVDKVCAQLGKGAPCGTSEAKLPGADVEDFSAYGRQFKEESGLSLSTSERLLSIYGVRSAAIAERVRVDAALVEPFCHHSGAIAAELLLAFEDEMAETLTDVLLRRTLVGLGPRLGLDAVDNAAGVAQRYLGWDDERVADEVERYRRYVERFCLSDLSKE